MRINPIDSQVMIKKYSGVHKAEPTQGFSIPETDGVDLSAQALIYANAVKEVRATLREENSSDAIRIHNLAHQIQQGTYRVDTSKIVGKMMESLL